jgi:hypothetical protein
MGLGWPEAALKSVTRRTGWSVVAGGSAGKACAGFERTTLLSVVAFALIEVLDCNAMDMLSWVDHVGRDQGGRSDRDCASESCMLRGG